jgi:hypothetical protein
MIGMITRRHIEKGDPIIPGHPKSDGLPHPRAIPLFAVNREEKELITYAIPAG